ncbi:MAG: DUF4405 domain-containing protein [Crenarchaeota archaeon]|nr:DUF4405 domain-containing protein [Thermoproteota archaeon]
MPGAMYRFRQFVSIVLLFSGLICFISGVVLYFAPPGRYTVYAGLEKYWWKEIHIWSSFIASGFAVLHIYLNWRALLRYFGIK